MQLLASLREFVNIMVRCRHRGLPMVKHKCFPEVYDPSTGKYALPDAVER